MNLDELFSYVRKEVKKGNVEPDRIWFRGREEDIVWVEIDHNNRIYLNKEYYKFPIKNEVFELLHEVKRGGDVKRFIEV